MGLIEGILGLSLFGSVIWALLVLAFVIVMLFVSDVNENGFIATTFIIIGSIVFYIWGRESFNEIISFFAWYHILAYFGLGLLHAFIRVFFYGRKVMVDFNETKYPGDQLSLKYKRSKIKENVFRWWFLWPVSLLVWIVQDIVRDVYNYCYDKLENLFNWIMELGVKSVKLIESEEHTKPSEHKVKIGFDEYGKERK